MKRATLIFSAFPKVVCNFTGHKLNVSKNVTNHIHEYKCERCGTEMTDTANGFLARLTPRLKETNDYISEIYTRRKRRLTRFAKAS